MRRVGMPAGKPTEPIKAPKPTKPAEPIKAPKPTPAPAKGGK